MKMNDKTHHVSRFRIPLVAGMVMLAGLIGTSEAQAAKDCDVCKKVAKDARKAGHCEALADYYIAVGKAKTYNDSDDRSEAKKEARQEYRETRRLVEDQYDARLDFCEALDECRYDPEIDPEDFLSPEEIAADPNPFLPLVPGTIHTYESETEEGLETIVVQVTEDTREVLGIECIVVRDTVMLEGEPVEDTWDWYTQDEDGNVWYFGELSISYEDGEIAGLEGSWEAGEDGAKPGIVMLADPQVGDIYRQEFLLGEAEDGAEVLSLDEDVTVPYGSFEDCLQTGDFLPPEPDAYELKYYAEGIGFVYEVKPESGETVELISIVNP